MIAIPNRDRKLHYLVNRQRGLCCCGCGQRLGGEPIDLHHMCKDSKGNRKNYPLFLHSLLNLQAVRHSCHMSCMRGKLGHISDYNAARYEAFLQRHPAMADFVNGKTLILFN